MQLSKTQINTILQNAPVGVDRTKILDGLIQRGYTLEGVDMATAKNNIGKQSTQIAEPNYIQRVGQDISSGFNQAVTDIKNPNSNRTALSKGVAAVSDIAGAVISPVSEAPGFKQVGELFSKGINLAGEQLAKLYSPEFKASLANMSPEQYQKATQTLQDLANAGNIANTILMAKGVAKTGELVKTGIEKTGAIITDEVHKIPLSPTDIFNSASKLKNDLQIAIAKKNVNPQLESSTNRLFLEGTKNAKDPIATYDGYLAQSKKALTDIKQDPAISVVGEKMGNAFETVVKQRQSVGRVLGDELNKKGKIKINVNEPKTALLSELKDSGLSYNPKTNSLTSFQGSKFAPEEVAMLDSFTKGVIALGDNPTVSQIDNFIAKTHSNLAFTKGKSGVIGTTNAERIINGGIAKLRATLDPAVNGNQALTKYWNANQTYSQLSDFVNEGSTFLGKKTLSGDFAKDASVAKSSVQSILNQGKKDFMIKLEALTGYNAIDDAVLALQAMKDAGDFRGLSLLQAMSDSGGIPTSKAGFAQKILDVAVNKGKEIIAGTPEEQTRAFLQDLLSKEKTTKPSTKSPTITPSVGKTTSSINQSNKSVISQKSTTIPKKVQGETPKQLEPIAQEAKKYKSAEEFVKAQGTPVYRGEGGSNVAQGKALLAEGKHFASDSKYPQGFGTVSENIIKPNAKVLDLGDSTFAEISQKLGIPERRYISPKELSTIAKEKGYDVLKYNGEYKSTGKQFTHFVDLTGDSTITKSQLTDIWNKAHKK